MAQILVCGASPRVSAALGHEPNLDGALPGGVGGIAGGGHRHLFDRVEQRAQTRKVAVGRFQVVVLDAHAVERDVDRASGQAADRRAARGAGGVEAGQRGQRVERVAAGQGEAGDRGAAQVRRDRRRLCLHHQRAVADDVDAFLERADRQRHLHARRHGRIQDHRVQDRGLESHQRDGDRIRAARQPVHREAAIATGNGVGLGAGAVVLDLDVGAGDDGAGAVDDRTRQRGEEAPLAVGHGTTQKNGEEQRCASPQRESHLSLLTE